MSTIDHPDYYNWHPAEAEKVSRRKMTWKEKGGCKPKQCKECGEIFKPETSGNLYCGDTCRSNAQKKTHKLAMRNYRKKNREHCRRVKANWDLRTCFGLSLGEYEVMFKAQNGLCAICQKPIYAGQGRIRKLFVDHDHDTGKIRGLLCHYCNTALGAINEDIITLYRMIDYIKTHKEK